MSEFDECASGQYSFGRLSKDQIYNAYQKTRARYQKYKGRYTDLAKYYKDLEREREKIKVILSASDYYYKSTSVNLFRFLIRNFFLEHFG